MRIYQQLETLRRGNLGRTIKGHDLEGNQVILKEFFLADMEEHGGALDFRPYVEPLVPYLQDLAAVPEVEGTLAWSSFEMDEDMTKLRIVRPYLQSRLLDQFPPDPQSPPSPALLRAFAGLAFGFDYLGQDLPEMSFFMHPGNLLWDGTAAKVADYGLVPLYNTTERLYINMGAVRHDPDWNLEVQSCFNSVEAAWDQRPEHIKSVFAFASLYFFIRAGCGPFSGNIQLHQDIADMPDLRDKPLDLKNLANEAERQLLDQALRTDSQVASCNELVRELRSAFRAN